MLLHSRQRFGATAVASLGGVRNTTNKNSHAAVNSKIFNPVKATANSLQTTRHESKAKSMHEQRTINSSHDVRHFVDTKTGNLNDFSNNDSATSSTGNSTSTTTTSSSTSSSSALRANLRYTVRVKRKQQV
jgi:hypothetical protein